MNTPADLLTTPEVADLVGVSAHTVKVWRARDTGPKFTRLPSRAVVYARAEVERWMRDEYKPHGNLGKRHGAEGVES